MLLNYLLYTNLIKKMETKDGVLSIKMYNDLVKEIQISEISKIYIENRISKLNFIYVIIIILILLSFVFTEYFEILILSSIILLSTLLVVKRLLIYKSKFLIIQFKKNKTLNSYKFKSNNKEPVLKIIREVKKFQKIKERRI